MTRSITMKTIIGLLAGLILLCSCTNSAQLAGSAPGKEISSETPTTSSKAETSDKTSGMTNEEIIKMVQELTDKGNEAFWWYMGLGDGLDVDDSADDFTVIRKVGRFQTIAELKAATEEIFTKRFCENILYPIGFNEEQGDNIKFREIDGRLYINENNGGMGWIDELTDKITVKENGASEITVTIISNQLDLDTPKDEIGKTKEVPYDFVLIQEDGAWKLDNWFDYGTSKLPTTKDL